MACLLKMNGWRACSIRQFVPAARVISRTGDAGRLRNRMLVAAAAAIGPNLAVSREDCMGIVLSLAVVLAAAAADAPDEVMVSPPREALAWPVCGRMSAAFGYRVDPFTGRVAFHSGMDIVEGVGVPIVAAEGGRVLVADRHGAYGLMVDIDHGNGWRTRYGQMRSISARVGETVARGARIGEVGSTGRSTGPHLHFEVWFNDVVRDPTKYLVASECTVGEINRSSQPER
jgi:murein DD-endopeptidase MepM/ murein hydrolase activator NlpD